MPLSVVEQDVEFENVLSVPDLFDFGNDLDGEMLGFFAIDDLLPHGITVYAPRLFLDDFRSGYEDRPLLVLRRAVINALGNLCFPCLRRHFGIVAERYGGSFDQALAVVFAIV